MQSEGGSLRLYTIQYYRILISAFPHIIITTTISYRLIVPYFFFPIQSPFKLSTAWKARYKKIELLSFSTLFLSSKRLCYPEVGLRKWLKYGKF
ncbi:hypothetical protein L873DRAFT_919762 [Choiromyces venosus 120613-1]|uniref:Uncharacterized protein n=1 Tax=Choiromyces venosus 120613-1 TaxID=1336337 RepID=A0A3N4JR75_9PEZI|nr:hypothetical protein L873DRAFT_919762 [Choiromyces venosus 120613-1]